MRNENDDKDDDVWGRMMSQTVGIGQLIAERRSMGLGEPKFTLFSCGRTETMTTRGKGRGQGRRRRGRQDRKRRGVLTRQYRLDLGEEVTFLIHESIDLDVVFGYNDDDDSEDDDSDDDVDEIRNGDNDCDNDDDDDHEKNEHD